MRRGAPDHDRRARRRPRDRASVPGRAGGVPAHRRAASDIALDPPGRSYLQELQAAGMPVHTVGKIGARVRRRRHRRAAQGRHQRGDRATDELIHELDGGLVFANLVETDQVSATATTSRVSTARCRGSTRPWASGSSGWTPSATCWSSPPTTASTRRPRHRSHARARAAARPLRRRRPPPRRPVLRRRRLGPALADRSRRRSPGRFVPPVRVAAALAVLLLVAGCGGSGHSAARTPAPGASGRATPQPPSDERADRRRPARPRRRARAR